jgi:hypothetical protein
VLTTSASDGGRPSSGSRPRRGLAIAFVLVGTLAAWSPAKAGTPAPKVPLTIPDVPRDGSRFGVLIVGEPDGTAMAARAAVSRALESQGHRTDVIQGLAVAPRREDVLRICAENELDGLAAVSVRTGTAPARADVMVLDANGDPFRGVIAPDFDGFTLRAPTLTRSDATFIVPAPESPVAAEPRPAPLDPVPPLLWYDDRDGSARLGEHLLGDGEVYRLLGRPDLEVAFQQRMHTKNVLLVTGVVASAVGVLLGSALWLSGRGIEWPSSDRTANYFYINGALLAVGVGALSASLSIDPHPIARSERLRRARLFNAARLPDDGDADGGDREDSSR